MISALKYTVPISTLTSAISTVDFTQFRYALNEPTGDFFYEPWTLKKEYVGTVWETILNTLPMKIGEARLIVLKPGTCYQSHADIDDRYHLNISGQYSFLVNLDTLEMFPQTQDGVWYEMDAGARHSAVNFGSVDRVQLVVRKLLNNTNLQEFNTVEIKPICEKPRFVFDDEVSSWLNSMNKKEAIDNFKVLTDGVRFNLDLRFKNELDKISKDKFQINIL